MDDQSLKQNELWLLMPANGSLDETFCSWWFRRDTGWTERGFWPQITTGGDKHRLLLCMIIDADKTSDTELGLVVMF